MDYKSIIESKYNRFNWQSLLHDIFRNKVEFFSIPASVNVNHDIAKKALYLGKITLTDGRCIAVYEVELAERVVIERNRSGIRNLLCSEWRGMGCAGAFMFCFRQNEAALRFSYVSEAWVFDDDGTYKKESTDPRRFTYLLGEGHRSRTAIDQFKKLKDSDLTLKDLTKTISVEAVSDMFFIDYKRQYENIIEYVTGKRMEKVNGKWEERTKGEPCEAIMADFSRFPNPEKAVRDYVKKLMGRLVFIQFLQKKGWMGCTSGEWKDGDKEYVQNLFAQSEYKDTFVDDVLEPLFADINTKREGDLASNPNLGKGVKIPYLNGGLFEKDAFDETIFPLPGKYMKNMLDFFASYNFTIDENDPNDAEMGVDPEMLGRVFENLLEDNKDKGAFYTPKEIVTYMCRESLIAYLQTDVSDEPTLNALRKFVSSHDATCIGGAESPLAKQVNEALRSVKICDPAIGSGAFPMGLLKELFACRTAIEGVENGKASEIKKHIIQQNIYGVDIEKGAVDIARLRFWLSLIIDEDTPHALPNMDFKIMQGNSLLEQYNGVDLSDLGYHKTKRENKKGVHFSIFDNEIDVAKRVFSMKMKEHFSCDNYKHKIKLRNEIKDAVQAQLTASHIDIDLNKIGDISANTEFFLWHTWFQDVFDQGGFDIVIGNPPYIKEYENRNAFNGFRESSQYYVGKMDLWHGFACLLMDMLRQQGILAFIAQNNWTTNEGAKKMRAKVIEDARILQLIDFNDYMVFEDSASIQTMIMIFSRDSTTNNYTLDFRKLSPSSKKQDMLNLLAKRGEHTYLTPLFNRELYKGLYITFSPNENILSKIALQPNRLIEKEATNGIHPHYDFVTKKIHKKHPSTVVGEGIFGLSTQEKNLLKLSKTELDILKPYYTTAQVKRYYTNPKNELWIIYTGSQFKNPELMNPYPNIKRHLDRFNGIITSDNKPYGLHRARQEAFFKGEKIAVLRKCVGRPSFSYSDFDCYLSATFYIIQTTRWNMKFLTGVLNSNLIKFWLFYKGKMQGENFQIDKEPLLNIPLPSTKCEQKEITKVIDKILETKKVSPEADTSSLEGEIDNLVYKLYGLTDDEIAIVENS